METSATSDEGDERKWSEENTGLATARKTDRNVAAVARRGQVVLWWVAMAIVTGMLGWAYAPNIRELVQIWSNDPNYSHGYLVLPVALVILFQREPVPESTAKLARISRLVGWAVLAGSLAVRAFCYEHGLLWLETATILPVIVGLVLSCGGWTLLKRAWPAIAFLVFLLPLPARLTADLALPLQRLATTLSCSLLRLSGLWVLSEGNTIIVDSSRLEVAQQCNGLSMLMCMAATVAATSILVPMPIWKRVVLLVSFIPIAILANVLRIAATAWCYHRLGAEIGGRFAHDAAGWLMMPMALVLVGIELAWLSWLVVEEQEQTPSSGFRPAWLNPEAEGKGKGGMVFPGRPGTSPRKPSAPEEEL